MIALSDVFATPVMQTLGWTLVHFLWQGTLVALVFAALLYVTRNSSSSIRYLVSCIGLALMVIAPIATFVYLAPSIKPVYQFTEAPQAIGNSATVATTQTTTEQPSQNASKSADMQSSVQSVRASNIVSSLKTFKAYLPWLVSLWLLGVIALSARLLGGLRLAHKLRTRATKPASEVLESTLRELSGKLQLTKSVRLRESLAVQVPVVIGWLRPVILLPSSVLTGLTVRQLELILAHELAHIQRNDYLVNILQKIAETLLFYHPAVWWISSVIRQERENCCDDLAVALCEGDKLSYAKTLSLLDGLRPSTQIALAASGGSLLKRIQRLAGKPTDVSNPAQWFVGLFIILVPWLVLSVATAQAKLPVQIEENIDAFVEGRLESWNVPGIQVAVIQDGEVTFNKAYGLADIENERAMTVDTPIQLGSASWIVHAIAAMQLVDQGKLDLDNTVSDYLPWVKFKKGEETTVTIRQLVFGNSDIPDTVRIVGSQNFTTNSPATFDNSIQSAEDYIRSLMPDKLYVRSSGGDSDYTYVNNDVLLMLVLESVSDVLLETYMQDNIFTPLQLQATYDIEKAKSQGLAVGYSSNSDFDFEENSNRKMKANFFTPPSALRVPLGLSMSSQDFVKLLSAIVNRDSSLLSSNGWSTFLDSPDIFQYLWGSGGWWGDNKLLSNIGITESSQVFFEIRPDSKVAYITMTNYILPTDTNPLYQVLGSVAQSLLVFDNNSPLASDDINESLPNPNEYALKTHRGKFMSALGTIELFPKSDELHGTVLGHEFKLVGFGITYITRSDFKPLNGLLLELGSETIRLDGRQFAYRVN